MHHAYFLESKTGMESSSSSYSDELDLNVVPAPSGPIRRTSRTVQRPEEAPFPATGKNGPRLKDFCFTINGTPDYLVKCLEWFQNNHGNPTWLIVARETCPKTGRKHLQGMQ